MINAYIWTTPNGFKVPIALEEMGLDYRVSWIDLGQNAQKQPDYVAIAPNGRIPAIHDEETGIKMMESGAILQYLAEKSGKFGGSTLAERSEINQWLHWQMGGLGPMFGQLNHFRGLKEPNPYGVKRYMDETLRLFGVLDKQLQGRDYIAGDYSIADMAAVPWAGMYRFVEDDRWAQFENVMAWIARNLERPATAKAIALRPS